MSSGRMEVGMGGVGSFGTGHNKRGSENATGMDVSRAGSPVLLLAFRRCRYDRPVLRIAFVFALCSSAFAGWRWDQMEGFVPDDAVRAPDKPSSADELAAAGRFAAAGE